MLQHVEGGTVSVFVAPDEKSLIAAGGWGQPIHRIDLTGESPNTTVADPRKGQITITALSPRELLMFTAGGNDSPPRGHLKFWKIVPQSQPAADSPP